jgi:bifunctional non-homologous end joining protein LigD
VTHTGTAGREVEIEGRLLRLTNLERVLWPRSGFTKRALIDYYRAVAPALLPHLSGRPVTLGRWPQGVDRRGFAQTECRGRPDWMRTAQLRLRSGEVRRHCVVEDLPSLLWVANLGTVELHTHQFIFEHPDEPDAVPLDLDPGPGVGLRESARAALLLREELAGAALAGWVKTSGSSGLHVVVPLGSPHAATQVKSFARRLAATLATAHGDVITDDPRPPARRGKVLVDWVQAEPRRLMVAPYSLRATDEPAVSTPVSWTEVAEAAEGRSLSFGASDVLERIAADGDLFAHARTVRQALPERASS